ncbi:MAG: hypothetical protein OXM03_11470 [Chloroflexota bacterium]|nr:hypothetical protein [Chloroflexota bacterium]MDE2930427.1 hypothetical protein [Chloroflexota bacterium]
MIKGIDRFLASILAVIFLIVVVAVVLVWRSPIAKELEYSADSNPEDVVHNFIVAVKKGNEERAKSYLSPEVLADIEERGSVLVRTNSRISSSGIRVVELEGVEEGLATVNVDITYFASDAPPLGLFAIFGDNQYSLASVVRLRQFDGEWKIVKPFDPYMLG